jgi:hypothetical protein
VSTRLTEEDGVSRLRGVISEAGKSVKIDWDKFVKEAVPSDQIEDRRGDDQDRVATTTGLRELWQYSLDKNLPKEVRDEIQEKFTAAEKLVFPEDGIKQADAYGKQRIPFYKIKDIEKIFPGFRKIVNE